MIKDKSLEYVDKMYIEWHYHKIGMGKEEQIGLIDNELVHLRAVQAQTKDAIDLWVKGGSDTTIQLMSPQTQQWAWPNQVEFENLEILEEISRLEQMKRYIIDLPF